MRVEQSGVLAEDLEKTEKGFFPNEEADFIVIMQSEIDNIIFEKVHQFQRGLCGDHTQSERLVDLVVADEVHTDRLADRLVNLTLFLPDQN